MSLIRLDYFSTLVDSSNNISTINDIISFSYKNNTKKNIGGKLYWNEKNKTIHQILEGSSQNIHNLFEKIKRDNRHYNINIVSCNDVTERLFSKWNADTIEPFKNENSINDFHFNSIIGAGGSGMVMMGTKKYNNKKYAIKIISKRRLNTNSLMKIIIERDILLALTHPFLNKLCFTLQDPCNLYIVTPFASRGDLYKCIHEIDIFPELAIFYLSEIVLGLDYLHEKNIIHADIKPENIIIFNDGHVKITDFGVSFYNNNCNKLSGTPIYFAPELILEKIQSKARDIWALGILMYEMFMKVLPWQNTPMKEMYNLITNSNLNISHNNLNTLLHQLLNHNHTTRVDITDVKALFLSLELIDNWDDVFNKTHSPPYIPMINQLNNNKINDFEKSRLTDESF